MLAFLLLLFGFKTKTRLNSSSKTTGVVFVLFSVKPQNELVWPKMIFFGIFSRIDHYQRISTFINCAYYVCKTSSYLTAQRFILVLICTLLHLVFLLTQFLRRSTAAGIPKNSLCRETKARQNALRSSH